MYLHCYSEINVSPHMYYFSLYNEFNMHGPLSPDDLVRERPFKFLNHVDKTHEKVGLLGQKVGCP